MHADQVALPAQRAHLQRERFLSLTDPDDALAAYYALYHDPGRTRLWLHFDATERVNGLVAVCQTGFNLFQPTVVLRATDDQVAVRLLRQALHPGRPYYVVTTPALGSVVQAVVHLEQDQINHVYHFDPRRYQPEINVLVQATRAADGSPKFVIRSQGQIAAEAGVNWRSPHFAEVFVYTHPRARGRGWGKAVVVACTTALTQSGVHPLYMVTADNQASIRLAVAAGFVDSGAREFAGQGVCLEKTKFAQEKAPRRA
ncbi:MAG: GNAT family N-acetyltransferase [Anaerolineae bacterium]|jgi:RimJ/RimL family protein N-acetyltransferase